jgi:hypothetical protein
MAVQRLSQMGIVNVATRYRSFGGSWNKFSGGARSVSTLKDMMELMVLKPAASPTFGGSLTVNSVALGNYDFTIFESAQTVSSFSSNSFFTTTKDTVSALITVNGNLTINSGQTIIPPDRKLFTCIYVKGNLTLNGSISMTAMGATHSGTGSSGGATTTGAIKLITGSYSSVVDATVPASGGDGAVAVNGDSSATGRTGNAAPAGGTGGGGSGGRWGGNSNTGRGGFGTAFSGGKGGAGSQNTTVSDVGLQGNDATTGASAGANTAGGTLIIFVTGTVTGTGSLVSTGTAGTTSSVGGGGSGGGSIHLICGTNSSSITTNVAAGAGGGFSANNASGGAGGAGSARILTGLTI